MRLGLATSRCCALALVLYVGCGPSSGEPGESSCATDDGDTEGECGDGVVDADLGEQCDDGNSSNTDSCTNECMLPVCGDGYVYEGVEECDPADEQGPPCNDDCTLS